MFVESEALFVVVLPRRGCAMSGTLRKYWENINRRFTSASTKHGTPAAAVAAGAAEDWRMGNAGAEVAATVAGGAAEDGPGGGRKIDREQRRTQGQRKLAG